MAAEIRKPLAITLKPCSSSRICAHGYDTETNTLALRFFKKGENGEPVPGQVYHYAGVEPETYRELSECESIGRFFGARINAKDEDGKLKYPFTKIEAEPEEAR